MRRVKKASASRRFGRTRQAWRRAASRWLRSAVLAGGGLLLLSLASGGAAWLWKTGQAAALADAARREGVEFSARMGLVVREILVEGRRETSGAGLLAALGVRPGDPLLSFDPHRARIRLKSIVWVSDAIIERRFTGTIYIRLTERRPMALWQRNGRLELIDEEGVALLRDGLDRFAHLLIIVGDDAPQHAPALLSVMASGPRLRQRVEAAVWVGGRRWNLRLTGGIDVRLPEENLEAAWKRLMELENRHRILARDVVAIDLRQPDRIVVQLTPAALERPRGPGEST